MKLKLDADGHVVVQDGKPVYIHDDGKEVAFDAAGTVATISRLNGEARGHREAKEAAEASLKGFEGITDPAAALKALETVKNLDGKRLIEAGEVEKVRAEAVKAVEEKYAPVAAERDALKGQIVSLRVGGSFDQSKFIREKMAIPADLAQARFGENFKLEGEQVVAYDKSGNKLFSREKPGEIAGFDEALSMLVDAYPYRNDIMKGTGASGGGAGGSGGAGGGKRTYTRTVFDGLTPKEQADVAKAVTTGTAVITD